MSASAQSFLFETLLWTGALIALVLLLRRPVARLFGARAAYALWLLPFARLLMPPLVLPAWLAPQTAPARPTDSTIMLVDATTLAEPVAAVEAGWSIDWLALGLAIWLLGASAFLIVRFRNYFLMRAELLDHAVPVGEEGAIRLVETPATRSPIAFGVFDKVVALPPGFMALTPREQRDLALEHEVAHHRAGDLLANVLVQPLFALHWFTPLATLGWRAMRRDQEAACDARVISARSDCDKATYAEVIASYATAPQAAPRLSLAAPMACPVIGDKSIIHRLRSLTMPDLSTRRRIAGRIMMAAAVLALPLTASISYAASEAAPAMPAPPQTAYAVPAPPAPPAPLAVQSAAEVAEAPEAPEPPAAPETDDDKAPTIFMIRNKDIETSDNGERTERKIRKFIISSDEKMSTEEREKLMKEIRADLARADSEVARAHEEMRIAMIDLDGKGGRVKVHMECTGDGAAKSFPGENGDVIVKVCESEIHAEALAGLKEARESIAKDKTMRDSMRAQVLEALDEQIERWRAKG